MLNINYIFVYTCVLFFDSMVFLNKNIKRWLVSISIGVKVRNIRNYLIEIQKI